MPAEPMVVDELENQERTGKSRAGGITFDQFSKYAEETRNEPLWRTDSDKYCDYYDGNQLTRETLDELSDRGMGPLITNLVAPTVNTVLGMEAKTRTDWRVVPDTEDPESTQVADALNVKLHEAERESRADRACSDAYAGQVKAGISWVEVGRHTNPFKSVPYRVQNIHRREMWWQWTAKEPDLEDSTYLIRRRWFDRDVVAAYFPKQKDMIHAASGAWPAMWTERIPTNPELYASFEQERGWAWEDYEWRDTARQRVCLFEVMYRTTVRGYVIKLPNRTIEYDKTNPVQAAAVSSGRVKPIPAIFQRLSRSLWLGPHKLSDIAHKSHKLPYVPFWGYREDITGIPYGVIRAMISPQDEVNARRQKLLWLLSAKRLTIDSDALATKINTLSDVLENLNRADAAIVLNEARRNVDAVKVDTHGDMTRQQFEVMQESKEALRQAAGVYQPFFDNASNAESGVAVANLMEMGSTTLAEINDNYQYARRNVGELLLDEIRRDLSGQEVKVLVGENAKKKAIFLNTPAVHPQTGQKMLERDTDRTVVKVALDDVPSTTTYRQQQFKMLSDTMRGLPPEMQAVIAPFWMEATDLPKRKELGQLLRKIAGIPDDPDAEEQPITPDQVQKAIEEAVQLALTQSGAVAKEQELELKSQELELKRADQEHRHALVTDKQDNEDRLTDSKSELASAQAQKTRDENDRDAVRLINELATQVKAVGDQVKGLSENGAPKPDPQIKEMARTVDRLQREVEKSKEKKGDDPAMKQLVKQMDVLQRELRELGKAKPVAAQTTPTVVFETGAIQVNSGGSKKITVEKGKDGKMVGKMEPDESGK